MQLIVGTVFLLAGQGASSITDKRLLAAAGIRDIKHFFSAAEAIRALKDEKPAMLVVHELLNDMTVAACVRKLRLHPVASAIPIVTLVGTPRVARQLDKQGGSAQLTRPFTEAEAVAAIARSKQPSCLRLSPEAEKKANEEAVRISAPKSAATEVRGDQAETSRPSAGKKSPPRGNVAASIYERGLDALRKGDLELAAKAFERAYAQSSLHASACLGRSRVAAMAGEIQESARWQCLAGIACLRAGDAVAAQNIFFALPRNLPDGNALLPHALQMLAEGQEKLSAILFLEAQALEPDTPLHQMVGRALLFTPSPEEGMKRVCMGFAKAGYDSTARLLRNRLFAATPEPHEEEEHGFLDAFPRLRDALMVAGHTFSLWRAA